MTKREISLKYSAQLQEYREALISNFFYLEGDKELENRIAKLKEAILSTVRKTERFSYYSFRSGLPGCAYRIISEKAEGEGDTIEAFNQYLKDRATSLRDEVYEIIKTDVSWDLGIEVVTFQKLCNEYRSLFEAHHFSREDIEAKLRSIKKQLRKIYVHPKMCNRMMLDSILLETIAKPTGTNKDSDALDAALSREAFSLLEALKKAFKKTSFKRRF